MTLGLFLKDRVCSTLQTDMERGKYFQASLCNVVCPYNSVPLLLENRLVLLIGYTVCILGTEFSIRHVSSHMKRDFLSKHISTFMSVDEFESLAAPSIARWTRLSLSFHWSVD